VAVEIVALLWTARGGSRRRVMMMMMWVVVIGAPLATYGVA
jgi:hypothetical protein